MLGSVIKRIFGIILNLIYPPRCIFCERFVDIESEVFVCGVCRSSIPEVAASDEDCRICFLPADSEDNLCSLCRSKRRYFSLNTACFYYEGMVRDCVLKIKAGGRRELVYTAAKLMAARILSFYEDVHFDLIVSAPSTVGSVKSRGFDFSADLASIISRQIGVRYRRDVLFKDKSSGKQSFINTMKGREANVNGKFYFNGKESVFGKSILLIDDIFTTGSTVNECSRVLCEEGAASVCAAVFAVAVMQQQQQSFTD